MAKPARPNRRQERTRSIPNGAVRPTPASGANLTPTQYGNPAAGRRTRSIPHGTTRPIGPYNGKRNDPGQNAAYRQNPALFRSHQHGEHTEAIGRRGKADGSSPRGRGTHGVAVSEGGGGRFIPAWAGNTVGGTLVVDGPSVHPRVGGEHLSGSMDIPSVSGSSPRGRGTQQRWWWSWLWFRFIPAWAGNTRYLILATRNPAVHPRVGGEHNNQNPVSRYLDGSSPRGRGTRRGSTSERRRRRFIPAWAGNTNGGNCHSSASPVHPRVGGEHIFSQCSHGSDSGSSPRGRGTREHR